MSSHGASVVTGKVSMELVLGISLTNRGNPMNNIFLIVTAIAGAGSVAINPADACALHLPNYELTGFPISSHQVAVLGSAGVEESTVAPTPMLIGMPASPHQIAVLTPRLKTMKIVEASADPSLLTVGVTGSSPQKSTGQGSCTSE